jgi:hypothetical protein
VKHIHVEDRMKLMVMDLEETEARNDYAVKASSILTN